MTFYSKFVIASSTDVEVKSQTPVLQGLIGGLSVSILIIVVLILYTVQTRWNMISITANFFSFEYLQFINLTSIINEIYFLQTIRISMRRNPPLLNAIELRNDANSANSCVTGSNYTVNSYTEFGWSSNTDPYYTIQEMTGVV